MASLKCSLKKFVEKNRKQKLKQAAGLRIEGRDSD